MAAPTIREVAQSLGFRLIGEFGKSIEFEVPTVSYQGTWLYDVALGAYSSISQNSEATRARIGRYCSIGAYCIIGAGSHPLDRLTTSSITYTPGTERYQVSPFAWFGEVSQQEPWESQRPVKIGHDVFIGSRAVVMEGVEIGTGAVIGAGAVVTKNVAPYSIIAGVPGRNIRSRFEVSVIDRLLALEWWKYDLRLWVNSGKMPKTSGLNHSTIDSLERLIASGEAPQISSPKHRIFRGEDRAWRLETNGVVRG